MTVSIIIEPETGIAIATCSGVLRLSDAKEGASKLWSTPEWSGKSAIWDFREAQFDLSPPDVERIARFVLGSQALDLGYEGDPILFPSEVVVRLLR